MSTMNFDKLRRPLLAMESASNNIISLSSYFISERHILYQNHQYQKGKESFKYAIILLQTALKNYGKWFRHVGKKNQRSVEENPHMKLHVNSYVWLVLLRQTT